VVFVYNYLYIFVYVSEYNSLNLKNIIGLEFDFVEDEILKLNLFFSWNKINPNEWI